MSTTVTWTQDGSSRYEVSSPEHLKQIMHRGTLYTDAGTFPTSYYALGTSYIQTSDIDLLSISTDIKPIGSNTYKFEGNYDGNGYAISNLSYIDPDFSNASDCEDYVGLFGYTRDNVIKNMRLTGVFILHGFNYYCAFFSARTDGTDIFNIVCDFDMGTNIQRGATINMAQQSFVGCLVGRMDGDSSSNRQNLSGVDIKGNVDIINDDFSTGTYVGGIAGYIDNMDVSFLRNMATFPSGIGGGSLSGGLIAQMLSNTHLSNSINTMTGDITATFAVGGIIGAVGGTHSINKVVNSMTGNIIATDSGYAGGITGESEGGTYDSLFNYMAGDITAGSFNAGGIVGQSTSSSSFTNSINAMNGNTLTSVKGTGSVSGDVTIDTNFGLTYGSNLNGTTTPLTGFLTLAEFPDLPYFLISGYDIVGNSYDYEFVFANLGGNTSYTTTHLIISQGVGTFQDGVDPPPPLIATPLAINIPITFDEVTGAIGYNITIEGPTGGEITVLSGVTELEQNITGLDPETTYEIKLYADTGTGYFLEEELTTTTLPNLSTNYNIEDLTENGVIDLRSLPENTISNINEVMADIFNTGDIVAVSVSDKLTSFINIGDTLSIKDIDGVLLPFEDTSGVGQDVTVTLSDDTTDVTINFDETVNSITVEGVVYFPGDSFILDGKKTTVIEY